jgi:PST family polysaccharide transporter/lipopolysaccharide exporter
VQVGSRPVQDYVAASALDRGGRDVRDLLRRLLARVVPTGTVLQRTVKSGIWMSATKLSLRMSQIVMLVVLARLLPPAAFGLVGIALLTVSAMRKFTRIGLNAALIQQEDDDVDEYLNTAWCLTVGRGVLIFGVLYLAAPYLASFFDEPQATTLIRVLGLSPVLKGLRNPGVVYFQKDLEYHKDFLYQSSGGLSQLVVGIGYALYSPTAWALVFASLSRPAVQTLLSYLLHGYRPWPVPELDAAKELVDYGKWITSASIMQFLAGEGDDAFVGWFLSATALGFYQYAYRLADLPPREVSGVIARISFPAYSKLQGDMDELRSAFLQTTRVTSFIIFPMGFGVALVAPSFVPVVLGSEWTPMVSTLQLLAMYGLMHGITRHIGSVWKALDHPEYMTYTGLVQIFCIAVLIWPATARWGFEGTALVVTGVYFFPNMPMGIYLVCRLTDTPMRRYYREYLYPLVASLVMFGSLWYARTLVDVPPVVELLVLVPAGAVIYVLVSAVLERQFDWGIEQILRTVARGME